MNEEIKNFARVLKATADFESADYLLKGFIKSRPQYKFKDILDTVIEIDNRFIGYTGMIVLKYTSKNINTNGLSIGALQRRALAAGNYEITLIAKEIKNV